jgi:ankyrin repeat protein
MDKGASINAKDKFGQTPLHLAISHVRLALLPLLLEKGANLNEKDIIGQTPLHFAASTDLTRPVSPPEKPEKQELIGTAVYSGNVETISLLLEKGATIDEKDNLKMKFKMIRIKSWSNAASFGSIERNDEGCLISS